MSIHELGLQHHGAADPLGFLEWSDEEYAAKAQPYGEGKSLQGLLDGAWQGEVFCNRLRRGGDAGSNLASPLPGQEEARSQAIRRCRSRST